MMWLKILGSLFIISAAAAWGFRAALGFAERPRHLRQIINCLAALKSQINYIASPLPEALVKSAAGIDGPTGRLFAEIGQILNRQGYLLPEEAWRLAYENLKTQLVLERPELETMSALFANLGIMDKHEQHRTISLAEYQLTRIQEEAQEISARNVKMYRYLGVCGGLAVVIIFI